MSEIIKVESTSTPERRWIFERQSGYAGYRCSECGTWIYSEYRGVPPSIKADFCKCTKKEKEKKNENS